MNTIRTIGKKIPQIRTTPCGKSAAINYITVKENNRQNGNIKG